MAVGMIMRLRRARGKEHADSRRVFCRANGGGCACNGLIPLNIRRSRKPVGVLSFESTTARSHQPIDLTIASGAFPHSGGEMDGTFKRCGALIKAGTQRFVERKRVILRA